MRRSESRFSQFLFRKRNTRLEAKEKDCGSVGIHPTCTVPSFKCTRVENDSSKDIMMTRRELQMGNCDSQVSQKKTNTHTRRVCMCACVCVRVDQVVKATTGEERERPQAKDCADVQDFCAWPCSFLAYLVASCTRITPTFRTGIDPQHER